jgi:hypothetical protein
MASTPGTITASGHVVVDADSPEMTAHFDEEKVVIELDDKNQPAKIRFGGKPAKTTTTMKGGQK